MKLIPKILLCLVSCATFIGAQVFSFAPAVKTASPSVVAISAERQAPPLEQHPFMQDPFFKHFFGEQYTPSPQEPTQKLKALGSGVLISNDGYILTNYHVIRETSNIQIKLLDGREFSSRIIGSDPGSDLAILKIDGSDLPVAIIGDSDKLSVGDIALAIGNPFGVGQTVTQGIVSALQRKNLGLNVFESYIQTDAAINPGNSGGALVDQQGHLIGINTAIISKTGTNNGIGLAIPINFAKQIMNELIKEGHISRGWLGVILADMTQELRDAIGYKDAQGILIRAVYANSPAAQSGIMPGDVLVSVNGKEIKTSYEARESIASLKDKEKIKLGVIREKEPLDFYVIIGKRPAQK